ncbi:MAG: dockerin type I repeat-containing protein, partial [candidate division Zixibacteria bacterium]|nr:dockerin type I repeat-containing protein [candidate division Zixibacteria bacterium]
MKCIMLKVSLAVLMILVCGAVHGQGNGALSLDHVDGLNYTEDSLTSNVQITFHLRLENDYGIPIDGAFNSFRVFSSNGAVWDATIGAMTGAITYAMCEIQHVAYTAAGTTGSGADTVGFGVSRSVNPGIPDGFDDIPYTITIGPISGASEGLSICLDSAFVPPSGVWKWTAAGVGEFFPSWDGPHCYPVGSGPCCVLRGDVDGNGFIDISDLVYLVDYIFNDGPEPPCWDEGDVDGSGIAPIDIADLVYLADYMFAQGPEPPPCAGADPVPVYPGGSISLHEVDGLYEAIDQVPLGDTVTFRMRVSNLDIGVGIRGIMNGFRIYGDDPGVNWTITESGPSGVSWFDTHWSISEFSVNGSGADTLGYGGYTLSGQGIPDGLDSLLFYIEVYVPDNPDNRNQFLCIDSSFFPPSGVWKWAAGSGNGNYNPSWSGPHCFKMVHVSDLQAGFSAAPTAGVAP